MDKTSLGNRMKGYEAVSKNYLMKKTPVILRLDGKAFHTFTKGFDKPFDKAIEAGMTNAMEYLAKNIQGCVLGYTQSDEITLVLCDYQSIDTECWYNYNVQKMTAVASSMATWAFNFTIDNIAADLFAEAGNEMTPRCALLNNKRNHGAFFDCRAFNLPRHEVVNCLIWRQQDATRNSIQALAQSMFSHKELQGLSCNDLQDKMFTEKGVNWNNLSTYQKRGSCVYKGDEGWVVDDNIPIFTEDRDYINSKINFE